MPLPLAMMIPFMGIQSAVMAKQFGENFQFGKRRISAMSNEEFNATTPLDLLKQNTAEIKAMIPTMEESVSNMRTFQTFLIREFLQTLNDAIKAGFGQLFGLSPDDTASIEHFLHGHPIGHEGSTDTLDEDTTGGGGTSTDILPPPEDDPAQDTTDSPPLEPQLFNAPIVFNTETALTINAIARTIINPQNSLTQLAQEQIHVGVWTSIKPGSAYSTRTIAMTVIATKYPSPKYFPSFRTINAEVEVYYFRVQ